MNAKDLWKRGVRAGEIARQRWMAEVEEKAVALNPALRGRIDWTTAQHLFNVRKSTDEAAQVLARPRD